MFGVCDSFQIRKTRRDIANKKLLHKQNAGTETDTDTQAQRQTQSWCRQRNTGGETRRTCAAAGGGGWVVGARESRALDILHALC